MKERIISQNLDANETAFFERELEHIKARSYDVIYPEFMALDLIPIETDAGWLVLSHGVGSLRKYCIGAFLLDLDDPSKVIGRLRKPLLKPNCAEREGYVPNVVYTCGALLHNGLLALEARLIPWGNRAEAA